MYGLQYIVCGGIHCLTASYNAVGSKILKHGFYSASSRDSHKTVVLFRLCRLEMLSFSYFFVLYSCFMLDPHIFYLRLGIVNQPSEFKSLFKSKSGIVRMNVNLYYFLIVNNHNAVADSFKISPQHKGI